MIARPGIAPRACTLVLFIALLYFSQASLPLYQSCFNSKSLSKLDLTTRYLEHFFSTTRQAVKWTTSGELVWETLKILWCQFSRSGLQGGGGPWRGRLWLRLWETVTSIPWQMKWKNLYACNFFFVLLFITFMALIICNEDIIVLLPTHLWYIPSVMCTFGHFTTLLLMIIIHYFVLFTCKSIVT